MKITSISFQNLKGQTAAQPIAPLNLFIGPNGAGKSTRFQCIGLSMLGYVPNNGKTKEETFKLATGESMNVTLATEAFSFTRQFSRTEKPDKTTGKKKVTISEAITVSPGRGEKNDTEKKARISAEIDSFPVMLDINEFLNMSDAKRRDFVYSLSPIASDIWDRERVETYLNQKLLTKELGENNFEHFNIMKKLIEEVMTEFKESLSIHDGLQAMIDWTSSQRILWDKKKNDAQGAVRQISDMKNQLEETDRNIAEFKKELVELQEKLIAVEKQISADTEKKKEIERRQVRLQEVTTLIDQLQNRTPESTDWIDQQIESLESQMIHDADSSQYEVLSKEKALLQQQINVKQQQEVTVMRQDITRLTAERSSVQQTLDTIQKTQGKACVINSLIACNKDFSSFITHSTTEVESKTTQINELERKVKSVEKAIISLQTEVTETEKEMAAVMQQTTKRQKENAQCASSIKNLQAQKSVILNAEQKRLDDLKRAQVEKEALLTAPLEAIGDIEILNMQVVGYRARINEVKALVEEKEKTKQTSLLLQQSMIENSEAEYKSMCLKSIAETLGAKGIQGELVKEIIHPIRSDIQTNLRLMGFDHEPFFQTETDTGKEVFQFGWINQRGHHVNFDALSTGQQIIFLAAMMVTILERANPRLKLLAIDNANHLDQKNFQLLINGLSQLAHKLDNIILGGAVSYPFEAEGWAVWNLAEVPAHEKSA